jgi:hypothetical protein
MGFIVDDAKQIYSATGGVIDHYSQGLPFDVDGRLVVEVDTIAYYDQGIGFTASGALAIGDDVISYYDQGVGFSVDGGLSQSGAGGPSWDYLLRTDFSAVAGQPVVLPNLQVLSLPSEGMVIGSIKIKDLSTGAVAVDNDSLEVTGADTEGLTGFNSNIGTIARQAGQVFKATLTFPVSLGNNRRAFNIVDEIPLGHLMYPESNVLDCFYIKSTGEIQYLSGNSIFYKIQDIAIGDVVELMFVLAVSPKETYMYIKKNSGLMELIDIRAYNTLDDMYMTGLVGGAGTGEETDIKITETLFPELVTPIIYDEFTGPQVDDMEGRTPDTIDNGNTWENYDTSPNRVTGVNGSGEAVVTVVIVDGGNAFYKIDAEEKDQFIIGIQRLDNGSSSGRQNYLSGRSEPGSLERINEIHAYNDGRFNNRLDIYEYTDGVGVNLGSVVKGDDYNYNVFSLSIVGTKVVGILGTPNTANHCRIEVICADRDLTEAGFSPQCSSASQSNEFSSFRVFKGFTNLSI